MATLLRWLAKQGVTDYVAPTGAGVEKLPQENAGRSSPGEGRVRTGRVTPTLFDVSDALRDYMGRVSPIPSMRSAEYSRF